MSSRENERRRPRDYATITTSRYRFRYDGRWLMTRVEISPNGGESYGPDLVDRWKARAFQQDPSSETPCCGYEEEDTNWGGSSTLLGERSGPVRTIRETWGADSGTNVIRRETFYRDEVRQKTFLRVHPIPPLDGIYAQWDFNAGRMTRYYSSQNPAGVDVDGRNDELVGNLDDPCNPNYDSKSNPNGTSEVDQTYRDAYGSVPGLCDEFPYHQSVDVTDPTLGELNSSLQWSVTAGPHGTIVDRYQVERVTDLTPGGAAQSLLAVPYYRDDSCFDDGTGTDPGPRLKLRSSDEPRTYVAPDGSTQPRKCWTPSDGIPAAGERFYQGDIGTHGLHILLVAESDNARQTVPLTEIVGEQRLVMLDGERDASVGETYGRGFEKPLVVTRAAGAAEPCGGPVRQASAPPVANVARVEATEAHAHHHELPTAGGDLTRVALSATLHCLTGCAIGEILGMVIGTAVGLSEWETVGLAVVLAFLFGYALTSLPLLRAGFALAAVIPIALASDTLSIAVMEVVDNAIMLAIPGAIEAGIDSTLFWGSLSVALVVAGAAALPVNRRLIARGKGHAVVHETGVHGGPSPRLVGAIAVVAGVFGRSCSLPRPSAAELRRFAPRPPCRYIRRNPPISAVNSNQRRPPR